MQLEVYRCIEKRINENRRKEDAYYKASQIEKQHQASNAAYLVIGFAFGAIAAIVAITSFLLIVKLPHL